MQIYINKNNQQLGPFDEAKVVEMLGNGQLSPNDLGIRQGAKEWQTLNSLFPNPVNKAIATPLIQNSPPKKSKKGLLFGCAGFFLVLLLVAGVLGFFAFRNMNPADSVENLPNSVKDLKLDTRYPPKGNIWGTETNFVGLYRNESKTISVLYLMTVYSTEEAAKSAMREGLVKTCQSGESPMYFSFLDKNGTETSQGATCAVPLYIQKGSRLATLGGSGAGAGDFIEFAENLPMNQGTTMKKKENK